MSLLGAISNVAFTIFGRPIYWYGIVVTSAIVCAYFLYLFLAKKRNIDLDFSLEVFIWLVVFAVLFCRLFYVIPRKEYFPKDFGWDDLVRIFNISEGGLTIIGGIFGGALGVLLCCLKNKKYSFAKVADCVVIAVLLGQIIGRWGNFFNQELFGIEITDPKWQFFPFAVYIDRLSGYYCALFFYEGVLNFIGLVIALVCFVKLQDKLKNMTIALGYLSWYFLVRGCLEFLKYEHKTFAGTEVGVVQVICFVLAPIMIVLTVLNQMGKITFETKWFARKIAEKQASLQTAEGIAVDTQTSSVDEQQAVPDNASQQSEQDVSNNSEEIPTDDVTTSNKTN